MPITTTEIDDAIRQDYSRLLRKREKGHVLTEIEQKTIDVYEFASLPLATLFRDGEDK